MSFSNPLHYNSFDTIYSVYSVVKEIAAEVRKEYRRTHKNIVCVLARQPIKAIINPLSMLVAHRYSEEATVRLLSTAIKKLHLLALEIERNYETRFVARLRELAHILGTLIEDCAVQLVLFDDSTYHEAGVVTQPHFSCFLKWLFTTDRGHFPQFHFPTINHTQLSLPFVFSTQ